MFKNLLKPTLILMCLTSLVFSGCKKDDNNTAKKASYTISFGGTVLANGQQLSLGSNPVGQPTELIFDLINISESTIKFTQSPTIFLNCPGFKVSQELPKKVEPLKSTQFSVVFDPLEQGAYQCDVNVFTDDPNGHKFVISLFATAQQHSPKMELLIDSIVTEEGPQTVSSSKINNGDSNVPIGKVETNKNMDITFAVKNSGSSDLTLVKNDNVVELIGSAFSLIKDIDNLVIQPGTSAKFTVRYNPTSLGNHIGYISIDSDDPNSPYSASIMGNSFRGEVVNLPEIAVLVAGSNIESGNNQILIGSNCINNCGEVKIKVVIKNQGYDDLIMGDSENNVLPITLADNDCFTITNQPNEIIPMQQSNTSYLNFKPNAPGRCCANVNILSNDDDEKNFTFAVCGDGYDNELLAKVKDYTVELHQNVGKQSHKVISYTFNSDLPKKSYVVFARDSADINSWVSLFTPALEEDEVKEISLFWKINDEELGTWESNDIDDMVIIKDPEGNIIDKAAVGKNAIKVRQTAFTSSEDDTSPAELAGPSGSYGYSITTNGAQGAPDPLTNNDGTKDKYTKPIYIYEIGERGNNLTLGGQTRLSDVTGNYVMFYLPALIY